MADDTEEQRPLEDQVAEQNESSSSSDDEDSDSNEEAPKVEWLATGREKRSTAGNRMKSMLAAEEPEDDDLQLLFAEDGEEDAGFTDEEDGDSDARMDSSSDDEDAQEQGDEEAGERELLKRAKESRQAARKRKAQEVIPAKFRKKVKINTNTPSSVSSAPAPRPKKKSERASWLPSPADMPTRASRRETTMLSKEQLHQQMVEREAKRLKQVAAMERKAARMEAMKKPPMTQEERLAQAAIIEKRNAKSLNRWEEAEKQREEDRRAKLAALNNRQLSGPVITFWSGMGEWVDGKLKRLGKSVIIEDRPIKKRMSAVGTDKPSETSSKDETLANEQTKDVSESKGSAPDSTNDGTPTTTLETSTIMGEPSASESKVSEKSGDAPVPPPPQTNGSPPTQENTSHNPNLNTPISQSTTAPPPNATPPSVPQTQEQTTFCPSPSQDIPNGTLSTETTGSVPEPQVQSSSELNAQNASSETGPSEPKPSGMTIPDLAPQTSSPYTTSVFAPPSQPPLIKAPEMKPPSSFLAPPSGVTKSGLSMPVLGYSSTTQPPANNLTPPTAAQRQSPLSMPQTGVQPSPSSTPTPLSRPAPIPPTASNIKPVMQPPPKPLSAIKPSQANTTKKQQTIPDLPPSPRPLAPPNGKATCNSIVLQNFNENAVEQKSVQQRILFGKETGKLGKQAPPPRCIITNKVARYKDPKTGLPYYDSGAYKEIQRIQSGNYKWSQLVGAWVGTGSKAAIGVPDRFLDPNAPAPPKPVAVKQEPALVKSQDGKAVEKPPQHPVTAPDMQPARAMPTTPAPSTATPGANTQLPQVVSASVMGLPAVDSDTAAATQSTIAPIPANVAPPSNIPAVGQPVAATPIHGVPTTPAAVASVPPTA